MTDAEVALLRAVLAAPDDDLVRLVFADWWDENGQPERAEFVRIQCELATMLPRVPEPDPGMVKTLRYDALRRRERGMLLETIGPQRLQGGAPPTGLGWCIGHNDEPDFGLAFAWLAKSGLGEPVWYHFERGFVAVLKCTATDCLAHVHAIRAATPLRKIVLTTYPDIMSLYSLSAKHGFGGSPGNRIERHQEILAAEFPGIEFELPDRSPPSTADMNQLIATVRATGHLTPGLGPAPPAAPAARPGR